MRIQKNSQLFVSIALSLLVLVTCILRVVCSPLTAAAASDDPNEYNFITSALDAPSNLLLYFDHSGLHRSDLNTKVLRLAIATDPVSVGTFSIVDSFPIAINDLDQPIYERPIPSGKSSYSEEVQLFLEDTDTTIKSNKIIRSYQVEPVVCMDERDDGGLQLCEFTGDKLDYRVVADLSFLALSFSHIKGFDQDKQLVYFSGHNAYYDDVHEYSPLAKNVDNSFYLGFYDLHNDSLVIKQLAGIRVLSIDGKKCYCTNVKRNSIQILDLDDLKNVKSTWEVDPEFGDVEYILAGGLHFVVVVQATGLSIFDENGSKVIQQCLNDLLTG